MVGRILPEQQVVKLGLLTKKAQRRKLFFTTGSYKARVFILDSCSLAYYSGTVKRRKQLKGEIKLRDVLAVETLTYKKSPNCGFQIYYEEDGRALILYVFAKTSEERDEWVKAIREEALKSGAYFILSYHPNRWHRHQGFACCGAPSRGDEGCMPVTRLTAEMRERLLSRTSTTNAGEVLADMMNKRSQGKSSLFGIINYKERVFVLDAHSLCYFGGNLKILRHNRRARKREGLKGSIELCTVLAVESVSDNLLDNRKNAFQIVYEDDEDQQLSLIIVARSGLKRQIWIQALRDEAKKSGARFQTHYHPGVWVKGLGKYNCCQHIDRHSAGCQAVTIDLQSYNSNAGGGKGGKEVRVGTLTKRALSKRSFTSSRSYKTRLFVLDGQALTYFDGKDKKRGEQKGKIPLSSMEVVAPLEQGVLDEHQNAFQVMYWDDEDQQRYLLYLVASNNDDRQEWLAAITSEAVTAGVNLSPYYHKGVWNKVLGKYTCCTQLRRDAPGCQMLSPSLLPHSSSAQPHSAASSSSSSSASSIAA